MSYKRKDIKKSKDYEFILQKKKGNPHRKNCCVSFESLKIQLLRNTSQSSSIIPTFNNDKLHNTDSFFIPLQGRHIYLKFSQKIVSNPSLENPQIAFPQPRLSVEYCSVCQDTFQDYIEHIKSIGHKTQLQNCDYTQKIQDLCTEFQQMVANNKTKAKTQKQMQSLPANSTDLFD